MDKRKGYDSIHGTGESTRVRCCLFSVSWRDQPVLISFVLLRYSGRSPCTNEYIEMALSKLVKDALIASRASLSLGACLDQSKASHARFRARIDKRRCFRSFPRGVISRLILIKTGTTSYERTVNMNIVGV